MKRGMLAVLVGLIICMFSVTVMADDSWVCDNCGETVSGNFCSNCGAERPEGSDEEETEDENWGVNLSHFLGGSFDRVTEELPDLEQTENSADKVKWESGSFSITGTDPDNVVRIRYSGFLEGYTIYGLYPGMDTAEAEELTSDSDMKYEGTSDDDKWTVYSTEDGCLIAYDEDEDGCVSSIYAAQEGYLTISYTKKETAPEPQENTQEAAQAQEEAVQETAAEKETEEVQEDTSWLLED